MKNSYQNWGMRVAAIIAVILALVFFGQVVGYGWMAITGAFSFAVWMLIWLWPERVPQRAEGERVRPSQRLVTKKDSYAGRS